MESNEILVERRAAHGKGSARKLRFAGRIPGVFYGPGRPAIPLTLDPNTVHAVVGRTGKDRLLRLKTAGADELDGQMVILKDAQRDPIKRRIIHADFFEIRMDREIEVTVPIHVTGKAPGVDDGGTLEHILRDIEVRCLPDRIPASVDVDVSSLGIGESIHVAELVLSEGVTAMADPRLAVVAVVAPQTETTAAPAAAAAEGAAATPAAGAAAAPAAEAKDKDKKEKKG
ncbi:MAG: 50S ribosomal protein L25 [bacterium]